MKNNSNILNIKTQQNNFDVNSKSVAILFDLDGVIIDSEKEYSKIWKRVNKEYPTGIQSLESVIKGCTLDKILDDHYPDPKIQSKVVARLYELEKLMSYPYLPGAQELLLELKQRNYPIALVTSSNDVKMNHLMEERPELLPMFDFIVTANLITRSKPDPEGYILAAQNLGVKPENCIVFEDSLQGVTAGYNSGAYVVGVAGTLSVETISPYCDEVVNSLLEINIDTLLGKLESRNNSIKI